MRPSCPRCGSLGSSKTCCRLSRPKPTRRRRCTPLSFCVHSVAPPLIVRATGGRSVRLQVALYFSMVSDVWVDLDHTELGESKKLLVRIHSSLSMSANSCFLTNIHSCLLHVLQYLAVKHAEQVRPHGNACVYSCDGRKISVALAAHSLAWTSSSMRIWLILRRWPRTRPSIWSTPTCPWPQRRTFSDGWSAAAACSGRWAPGAGTRSTVRTLL